MIILYVVARLLIRVSIILFYLRIFQVQSVRRKMKMTLILTVISSVPIIITAILACHPIPHTWQRWDGTSSGQCINDEAFLWAGWLIFLANDLCKTHHTLSAVNDRNMARCWNADLMAPGIVGVPLPYIAKLQLSLSKRILVSAMFGSGLMYVSILTQSLRPFSTLTMNVQVSCSSAYTSCPSSTSLRDSPIRPVRRESPCPCARARGANRIQSSDDQIEMAIWACVEINVGVIVACMPSIVVLLRPIFRRFKQFSRRGSAGSGNKSSWPTPESDDAIAFAPRPVRRAPHSQYSLPSPCEPTSQYPPIADLVSPGEQAKEPTKPRPTASPDQHTARTVTIEQDTEFYDVEKELSPDEAAIGFHNAERGTVNSRVWS